MGKRNKPVYEVDSKTVISFDSPFGFKKLCDYLTFSLGMVCVYSCAYCYALPMIFKLAAVQAVKQAAALLGRNLEQVVIRKREPLRRLRRQLTIEKPTGVDLRKKAVIYTSPLVDACANMVLVKETAEACRIIFEYTNWDVRVLSKSNLLPELAKRISPEFKDRMIYGVSTGTLDDGLAAAFEKGTAPVSKRLKSIHFLQDNGHRTFYMFCPVPPQADYDEYVERLLAATRIEHAEHVWVEVMNLRGDERDDSRDDSLTATSKALEAAGFHEDAERLVGVCGPGSKAAWEEYSRNTFEAFAKRIPASKLRFLQYADPANAEWWIQRESQGAVLLGEAFE